MLKSDTGHCGNNFVKVCGLSDVCSMNYLAHAWLSFNVPGVLAGNMISDFVKGRKQYDYPPAIRKGIQLHRAIDNFTDTHEATQRMKAYFRPQYRLYAGAFSDVVYDYFLANDTSQFAGSDDLEQFAAIAYGMLDSQLEQLPPGFVKMYGYMRSQNWLFNYREKWMIEKSFHGLQYRAAYLEESAIAYDIFCSHIPELQSCYDEFFPGLKIFAAHTLDKSLNE